MPADPVVWIVLIVAVAIVAALTLWLGRGLKLKLQGFGMDIKERQSGPADSGTTVFKEGQVVKGGTVGNITGVKNQGGEGGALRGKIDVASGVRIEGSAGDITGVEITGKPREGR